VRKDDDGRAVGEGSQFGASELSEIHCVSKK